MENENNNEERDFHLDYQAARRTPLTRQAFLDEIDFEEYNLAVGRTVYVGDSTDRAMNTIYHQQWFSPFRIPSTIEVSDEAFMQFTSEDFYNALVHHEGFRAQQFRDNPATAKKVIKWWVDERFRNEYTFNKTIARMKIDAHVNQMDHPSFEDCSDFFKKHIDDELSNAEDTFRVYSDLGF